MSKGNETQKRSEAIALYMGKTEDEYPKQLPEYFVHFGNLDGKDMKYHSSWDWLMPVVKKIMKEDDYCGVYESLKACLTWCDIEKLFIEVSDYCISINPKE